VVTMGGTVITGCEAVGVDWTSGEAAGLVSGDRGEVREVLAAGAAGVACGVLGVGWIRDDGEGRVSGGQFKLWGDLSGVCLED
jgi:hypothetical protein